MAADKEEMFDIVDENDNVIGKEMRSVVHSKGILHRGVHVFIFNSRREVFLQKRSPEKLICPSIWDMSVSEHLNVGEDYKHAALRGLREELSVDIKNLTKLRDLHPCRFEYNNGKTVDNELVEFYKGTYDGKIKIDKNEVSEGRFSSSDEIKKMIKQNPEQFTPWFIMEWKYMEKKGIV